MRPCRHIALLACLALAQAGCADQTTGAVAYTCGHMSDTVGAFREQARLIVDREGFKTSALSIEEAVLEVEQMLRDACHAGDEGDMPYDRVARSAPAD